MSELFATGRVIDLILGLMALEGGMLWAYRLRTGRGVPTRELAANLLAGGSILLAVRVALTGGRWEWVGLCLLAALLAHLWDLKTRWEP